VSVRVASLLPAATEWLCEMGFEPVAVSHECDFPVEAVRGKPRVTSSRVDAYASPGEIDRQVRALRDDGEDLYALDEKLLAELAPDVIVTQAQCDVCAVSEDAVRAFAEKLTGRPKVVALRGSTIKGIEEDVLAIGEACLLPRWARMAVLKFERGLEEIRATPPARRRRFVHLEWTDPPMLAASWIPELAAIAGLDLFRADLAGKKSVSVTWEEIRAFAPELVVVAPCGFDLERATVEGRRVEEKLPGVKVVPVDGNALFNRPGPRLVFAARVLAGLR
jgi:iron complex transport system substrate-binding protein